MSETKHTPGPLLARGFNVLKPFDLGREVLAECKGTPAQAKANAVLYAAAPDLLEALRRVSDADSLGDEIDGIVRAAIAKATGGAT